MTGQGNAGGGPFPATRHSIVAAAGSADPEVRRRAFETLVSAYWKPVYKYLRLKWQASEADAEDLTQGFFARAFEKGFFDRFDPARARFRTYLRTCLDGYVANERQAARRLKRGGASELLPLDFKTAEGELRHHDVPDPLDMEEYFHREWVRSLFAQVVERLREQCAASGRSTHFALFERYDLEGPDAGEKRTYADLGAEFGLPTTQVTNFLFAVRREFRGLVLETLRDLSASDEEFRAEARDVLGIDPPHPS
jgi:RNA polymerase sigma factor (sigma-70 family)